MGLLLTGLIGGYCAGSFVYWDNWWLLCGVFCGVCVVAVGVLECGLLTLCLLVLFGVKWCVLPSGCF